MIWNDRCGPQMAMPSLSNPPVMSISMPVQFKVRMSLATVAKGWRWVANEMVEILYKNYMTPPHSVVWNDNCGPQMAMSLLSDPPVMSISVQFKLRIPLATSAKGWMWVANEIVEILYKNYMVNPPLFSYMKWSMRSSDGHAIAIRPTCDINE